MKHLDWKDGACVLGALLIVVGVGMLSVPAALIIGGAGLVTLGTRANQWAR